MNLPHINQVPAETVAGEPTIHPTSPLPLAAQQKINFTKILTLTTFPGATHTLFHPTITAA